jgi:hypothetical protein
MSRTSSLNTARTIFGLDSDFKTSYSSSEWGNMELFEQKEAIQNSENGFVEVVFPTGSTFRYRMGESYDEVVMWGMDENMSSFDRAVVFNAQKALWLAEAVNVGGMAVMEIEGEGWMAKFQFE